MSLLGEPDNAVYRLAKAGTRALLDAVDAADAKGAAAKASKALPCEAVKAYLEAAFLGPLLRSASEIPYAANAGVLGTYVEYLDGELARGAPHVTPGHQAHLKLLVYVLAIEASAPLSVYGNCLEFLARKRESFDFGIYYDKRSTAKKLDAVSSALEREGTAPQEFRALHGAMRELIDRELRNAVAHATYRVHPDREQVDIWDDGERTGSLTFEKVDQAYRDARGYQQGFVAGVSDFAARIHPDCPYAWRP